MRESDVDRLLAASPIFGQLEPADRARLVGASRRKRYGPRQTIFQKGDPGTFMLAVVGGCVRVCLYSDEGREIVLNIIEAGEVLGEIAVLDGRARTADAVAIDTVEGLLFDRRDILQLMRDRPEAAIRMLEVLCHRLRRTSGQVEAIAFHDLPARLAMLLVSLAEDYGVETEAGLKIDRPLAQRDLGRLIGSTRESVNRQLRAWVTTGVIAVESGYVTIIDREALEFHLAAEPE